MERLANKIAYWMVRNGALEENREVIAYALISVLYEILLNPIILIVAAFRGVFFEMIIWTAIYIPLRRNMGGRHEANSRICFIVSLALALLSAFLIEILSNYSFALAIEALFSVAVAFICAPVLHKNHPYPNKWKNKAKINSRIYIVLSVLFMTALYYVEKHTLAHAIGISMVTVSSLCLIGYISNMKH